MSSSLISCEENFSRDIESDPQVNLDSTKFVRNLNPVALRKNYVFGLINYENIVSDSILRFKPVFLHTPPSVAVDVQALKSNVTPSGSALEYIALGSSLTAGVRDGGYTNEGMLTAYPALLARQMKLAKFESPLFDPADFNGAGKKVLTSFNPTQGPGKKFAVAANNLAIEGYDESTQNVILKKGKLSYQQLHNLAVPDLGFEFLDKTNTRNRPFIKRITFGDGASAKSSLDLLNNVKTRKVDFFTFEMGSQAFGGNSTDIIYAGETINGEYWSWEKDLLEKFSKEGAKGIVINMPNFYDFPYYKQFPCEWIEKNSQGVYKYENCSGDIFLGSSSAVDSLASPVVNSELKRKYIYLLNNSYHNDRQLSAKIIDRYNSIKSETSKKYGYAVVDLHSLYARILKGEYVTSDGVKVDPNWPSGNFFSQDGVYPTAFGHAIIANEIIKTINDQYKVLIPLITTREYLK